MRPKTERPQGETTGMPPLYPIERHFGLANTLRLPPLPYNRQERNKDDAENYRKKIPVYGRNNGAECIPQKDKDRGPSDTPKNVVGEKRLVFHAADTGKYRSKSPYDGNKASQDDGLLPMLLIEGLGAVDMLLSEEE